MRKLLSGLVVTVALLVSSCGTPGVVAKPSPPCWVPPWPADPEVTYVACADPNETCMTKDSAVNIGLWVRDVIDYHNHVVACPGVER